MKRASWGLLLVCCACGGCLANSAGKSAPSPTPPAAVQPVTFDQVTPANAHKMADSLQREMDQTGSEPFEKKAP